MRSERIRKALTGEAPCSSCGVRDLVLFADLAEDDFDLIHLPIQELDLAPGDTLYHAEEEGGHLFTIRSGRVKLSQSLADGTQRIVRLLGPGATAGMEVLVGAPYEHTAVALQQTLVCRIPREVVERLDRGTPHLHRQLMQRWHDALRQADRWLTGLSTGSARERLARLILSLLEAESDDLTLFGREDVGAMLGLTTETASRTVAEFRRSGLLKDLGDNRYRAAREALEAIAGDG